MEESASYTGNERKRDEPSGLLPTDEYTRQLAVLRGASLVSRGTVETTSPYGHTQTWLAETHRIEDSEWVFLQRIGTGPDGRPEALRLVLPPLVAQLFQRQHAAVTDKARSRGAKQAMETRRANGTDVNLVNVLNDPKVRAKALKARKAKAAKRQARRAKARV